MKLFLIGFLFIFFDYDVIFEGGHIINFIPDFVGYLPIIIGCIKLHPESNRFFRVRILAAILAVWSVTAFTLGAVAVQLPTVVETTISVAATLLSLYMTYEFCEGVRVMERARKRPIGASSLSSAWIVLCMANLLFYLTAFFPAIYLLCLILQLLAIFWFEYAVYSVDKGLSSPKRR